MFHQLKKQILSEIVRDIERVIIEIEDAIKKVVENPNFPQKLAYNIYSSNDTFAETVANQLRDLRNIYLDYLVKFENIDFKTMTAFTTVKPWALFEVAQYKDNPQNPHTLLYFMLPVTNYGAGEKNCIHGTNLCFELSKIVRVDNEAYYLCDINNSFYDTKVGFAKEWGGVWKKDISADPERMTKEVYDKLWEQTPEIYQSWQKIELVAIN